MPIEKIGIICAMILQRDSIFISDFESKFLGYKLKLIDTMDFVKNTYLHW